MDADEHMRERTAERDSAAADFWAAQNMLAQERRQPDAWERVCLVRALSAMSSGCYTLASVEARLAMTPPDQRSPSTKLPIDPIFARADVTLLERVCRAISAEPVLRYPHFGPIELTGVRGL